nr:hypothetical protein [Tanacetum cinerariifolium]
MTKPYLSHRFIANCFNLGNIKMEVKVTTISLSLHNISDPETRNQERRRDAQSVGSSNTDVLELPCLLVLITERLRADNTEEYRHSAACGRFSTGSQKLPEEAQPYKARHVSIRSKATRSVYSYSNPRGFIYQNKDKKNRLMRIDELHKFSDGTLNDVRNALDDRLKGIRMQYLPTTVWRKGDKDRAAAMIQAIDKMLKTRRIMRSLERIVGGR